MTNKPCEARTLIQWNILPSFLKGLCGKEW